MTEFGVDLLESDGFFFSIVAGGISFSVDFRAELLSVFNRNCPPAFFVEGLALVDLLETDGFFFFSVDFREETELLSVL